MLNTFQITAEPLRFHYYLKEEYRTDSTSYRDVHVEEWHMVIATITYKPDDADYGEIVTVYKAVTPEGRIPEEMLNALRAVATFQECPLPNTPPLPADTRFRSSAQVQS